MKHLIETKMVEQKTEKWFADDGKEFDNETACVTYERRLNKENVEREFSKLKHKFLNIPMLEWFYGGDEEVVLITVEEEKDFLVAEDYFASKTTFMDLDGLKRKRPTSYPADLIIVSGCEWADVYGTKEDLLEETKKLLKTLE